MLEIFFPGIKEGQYTLAIIISCISVALRLRTVASPLHFHIHYRLRKVRIYRQSSAGSQKQTINGMKKGLRMPKYRRHPLSFPLLLILVAFSVRMNSHQ